MSVERKIDRLIEEANQRVADSVSQVRGGDIVSGLTPDGLVVPPGGLTLPNTIGGAHAGYKAGNELGHPIAGVFLKQEGAAGARSKWDPSVSIGDVYTGKNIGKRVLQGVTSGLIGGSILSAINPSLDLAQGMTGGALIGGAVAPILPGTRYGLGKVFGSNTPSKDRTI